LACHRILPICSPAVNPAWQLKVSMDRFRLRELVSILLAAEACNARWHYLVELMSIGGPPIAPTAWPARERVGSGRSYNETRDPHFCAHGGDMHHSPQNFAFRPYRNVVLGLTAATDC